VEIRSVNVNDDHGPTSVINVKGHTVAVAMNATIDKLLGRLGRGEFWIGSPADLETADVRRRAENYLRGDLTAIIKDSPPHLGPGQLERAVVYAASRALIERYPKKKGYIMARVEGMLKVDGVIEIPPEEVSLFDSPGRPPMHFNCRTKIVIDGVEYDCHEGFDLSTEEIERRRIEAMPGVSGTIDEVREAFRCKEGE
jgi:hypothetical protein